MFLHGQHVVSEGWTGFTQCLEDMRILMQNLLRVYHAMTGSLIPRSPITVKDAQAVSVGWQRGCTRRRFHSRSCHGNGSHQLNFAAQTALQTGMLHSRASWA